MPSIFDRSVRLLTLLTAAAALLSACGGGGGGGGSSSGSAGGGSTKEQTLTGLAATGSPIYNAVVSIKDSTGKVVSTTTDNSGVYTANVAGLQVPVMVQVNGLVSGNPVLLTAPVTTLPAVGASETINVTPLSNAVVAVISGRDPARVFNSGSFSAFDAATIASTQSNIKSDLSGYFQAVSVGTSFDILTQTFTPNLTGFDKLLALLQVAMIPTDASGDVSVQITSRVAPTQSIILDSSGNVSAGTFTTPPFLPDFSGIDQIAVGLTNYVQNGRNASALNAVVDPSYLGDGENNVAYVSDLMSNAFSGDPLVDPAVSIVSCSDASDCEIEIGLPTNDQPQLRNFARLSAGTWLLYGNQRNEQFALSSIARLSYRYDGVTSTTYDTGLNILITKDVLSTNSVLSAQVYAITSGGNVLVAQLASKAGCANAPPPAPGYLQVVSNALDSAYPPVYCDTVAPLTDAMITQIGTNPQFMVVLYSDTTFTTVLASYSAIAMDGSLIPSATLSGQSFVTPKAATVTKVLSVASAPTSPITIAWNASAGVPATTGSVDYANNSGFWYITSGTSFLNGEFQSTEIPDLNSETESNPSPTGSATYSRITIDALDANGRTYRTRAFGCGGGSCT